VPSFEAAADYFLVMNFAFHAEKVREIIVSGTVFGTVTNIVSK